MHPRALAVVTILNLCALLGSALMFYNIHSYESGGDGVPAPPSAPALGVEHGAQGFPEPAEAGTDIRLATLMAEVFNLRGEVDALRAELQRADSAGDRATTASSAAASTASDLAAPELSDQEEFLVAVGDGSGLENIGTAFAGADGVELGSSMCQGNMCRVSYQVDAATPGQHREALTALTRQIAESVGADVDMVFANEAGESVIYVKRVN